MEKILNDIIDRNYEEMTSVLHTLIEKPSVIDMESAKDQAPFGIAIREALDEVLRLGKELGFVVKDYDGYAASLQFGEMGKEIGLLSHLDVVPPGNGWKTNPFEPVTVEGNLYGRGTIDDKGPMVAALYAMKAIKESQLPIKNHVNHIIGCDEETGHRCIKYYLTKEKSPDMGFSPDGIFPVIHAEKGILRFTIKQDFPNERKEGLFIERIQAGTVVNSVPNIAEVWLDGEVKEVMTLFQKRELDQNIKLLKEGTMVHMIFTGTSAHAMQPWLGKSAILPMIDFLRSLPFADSRFTEFFASLHELFADGWEGKDLGIACQDMLSGKLSLNLGTLQYENHCCEIKVDVRCPVHVDLETIWNTILLNCEKYGFHPEYWQKRPPLYVPKESELVQKLLSVYNEMTESNESPIVIGGGTYCRDVENFVSFGPVFPGEPELAHEANECIDLKHLLEITKIYAQALYILMK